MTTPITAAPSDHRLLWPYRTVLRKRPGMTKTAPWYDWHQVASGWDMHPWSIVFPWVATHPHFSLVRGSALPLNSAPEIRLSPSDTEHSHLGLLGVLNSSAVCFWLKQMCAVHDRDHNAARNVLFEGRRIVAAGRAETLNACGAPVRRAHVPAQRGEAGSPRKGQPTRAGIPGLRPGSTSKEPALVEQQRCPVRVSGPQRVHSPHHDQVVAAGAVSYTHLTLPTNREV